MTALVTNSAVFGASALGFFVVCRWFPKVSSRRFIYSLSDLTFCLLCRCALTQFAKLKTNADVKNALKIYEPRTFLPASQEERSQPLAKTPWAFVKQLWSIPAEQVIGSL